MAGIGSAKGVDTVGQAAAELNDRTTREVW